MSDGPHKYRQMAGLALVVVVYLGGIVGWTCAVLDVETTGASATTRPEPSSHLQQFAVSETGFRESTPPRHASFTRLLERFVDTRGDVDYVSLQSQADSLLAPYLTQLATANLKPLSRDARLALWINAYNAYTLKLIVDHYPVRSIRAIDGPAPDKTPFQRPVGRVADTMRTLDEIEHEIIRERFDEPRIHFALVCAAKSCPRLRREAYTAARLDAQLDEQARRFLHDKRKNQIPAGDGTIALSRILKWYGSDFGPTPAAVQRALAPYFGGTVRDSLERGAYDVRYRSYDWTLNDQTLAWGAWPSDSASES